MKNHFAVAGLAFAPVQSTPTFASFQPVRAGGACLDRDAVASNDEGTESQDIARQHPGRSDAAACPFENIRHGGGGVRGPVQMLPDAGGNESSLNAIVAWPVASGAAR